MTLPLHKRVAIVTGSARGIGFATARKLAETGAAVLLCDLHGHAEAAAALDGLAGSVSGRFCDVTSEDSVATLVQSAIDEFGSVDILVNNAAISSELKVGPFEEASLADWKRVLDVNVIGAFLMCRAVSPHMRARRWGRIVNIASGTAFKGIPGKLHYVASKGALLSMTRTLANEFGVDNVLVNCVSPGFTVTEGVRASEDTMAAYAPQAIATRAIKRDATPEDVANAIYFFATEEAGFVTGQTLAADGGSVFH